MISAFLKKVSLFSKKESKDTLALSDTPKIISRKHHSISRNQISENAVKVLYRLHKGGYKAYLVGGGVRDILLGLAPKDFDVATDASPEQVKSLFSNCRLIGRRFRLAHVFFGRDIIEVATFRANHNPEKGSLQSDDGMIVRDNVFGEMDEDAWRRDFTVNALYYNIADFSIVDYTGGMRDLQSRTLRLIGEPDIRFREDPVRMIRAIRLSAKLDLEIDKKLIKPIKEYHSLITNVPAARLFEEILKMFHSGAGEKVFAMLKEYGFFELLFPMTAEAIKNSSHPVELLLQNVFESTDMRIRSGKPVNPAFLFAAFLYYPVIIKAQEFKAQYKCAIFPATIKAMDYVIAQQAKRITIPKRIAHTMREIWVLQMRFTRRHGRKAEKLFQENKFRAAYDFLLMRQASGEKVDEIADWWTQYTEGSSNKRRTMVKALNKASKKKNKNIQNQEDLT